MAVAVAVAVAVAATVCYINLDLDVSLIMNVQRRTWSQRWRRTVCYCLHFLPLRATDTPLLSHGRTPLNQLNPCTKPPGAQKRFDHRMSPSAARAAAQSAGRGVFGDPTGLRPPVVNTTATNHFTFTNTGLGKLNLAILVLGRYIPIPYRFYVYTVCGR